MRKERALVSGKTITGNEDFNYFMSIIYASDNLEILDYNRVIRSFNGLSADEFMDALKKNFAEIREYNDQSRVRPGRAGVASLLLQGKWYECTMKNEAVEKVVREHGGNRAVSTLDVQVLNDCVLRDILGI